MVELIRRYFFNKVFLGAAGKVDGKHRPLKRYPWV